MKSQASKDAKKRALERRYRYFLARYPDNDGITLWRVRRIRSVINNQYYVEFRFKLDRKRKKVLFIDAGEVHNTATTVKRLRSAGASLGQDAIDFVGKLVKNQPAKPILAVSQPGFCLGGTGFVMPKQRFGSAKHYRVWDPETPSPSAGIGMRRGSFEQYSQGILAPARESPYLSLAIGLPLASALVQSLRSKKPTPLGLPTEGALFHFASGSSSGKTTLGLVMKSVFGEPRTDIDFGGSDRALEEFTHARNCLGLFVDESEAILGGGENRGLIIAKFAKVIASGQSKARSTKSGMPSLKWFCYGLSTGPETVASLSEAREQHGEVVRIFDITVPPADDGGIFALGRFSSTSGKVVEKIEAAMQDNYGLLLEIWIDILLDQSLVETTVELINKFRSEVDKTEDKRVERIIKKFGTIYAALQIATDLQLLPWREDWPLKAVVHCYESALDNFHRTETARLQDFFAQANRLANNKSFAKKEARSKLIVKVNQIGFYKKGKTNEYYFFGSRREPFVERLAQFGMLLDGDGKRRQIKYNAEDRRDFVQIDRDKIIRWVSDNRSRFLIDED